jgi:hypothetical protein
VVSVTIPANLLLACLKFVNNPKEFENGYDQDSGELEEILFWINSPCGVERLWERLVQLFQSQSHGFWI